MNHQKHRNIFPVFPQISESNELQTNKMETFYQIQLVFFFKQSQKYEILFAIYEFR